ncbi:MAG: aldo/keto reductase [Planctomycetota bacterium]|nr:MAG: aldo/keto reductase [Planctomycetota bacterium]
MKPSKGWEGQEPSPPIRAVFRKRIPKTGEWLPAIGLGSSRTFDADPKASHPALEQVLSHFLDFGGSLVDSSPMYGQAEALIGSLVRSLDRRDLFFATKVWTAEGKKAGIAQMESSQEKMEADRIDLMQIHNLVGLETHLPTLREWKAEGRIRYLGITEMRDWERIEQLILKQDLDFIQIPYSLAFRKAEERILPAARDHGVAVLVMRPFERGRLFRQVQGKELPPWAATFGIRSWAQFFLKYLLAHPAVSCPIPATSKPHHLIDNMGAGHGPLPDEATRRKMVAWLES